MLGINLKNIRKSFNEWRCTRQLVTLAKRESFSSVKPEAIGVLLTKVSHCSLFTESDDRMNATKLLNERVMRIALLAVWELSSREEKRKTPLRFKWHRIMAQVNQLYATLENAQIKQAIHG